MRSLSGTPLTEPYIKGYTRIIATRHKDMKGDVYHPANDQFKLVRADEIRAQPQLKRSWAL